MSNGKGTTGHLRPGRRQVDCEIFMAEDELSRTWAGKGRSRVGWKVRRRRWRQVPVVTPGRCATELAYSA